ncbi:MAG: peptidylprolyl isomerase [Myxococcota bacterium]
MSTVSANKVVFIHYVLTDDDGQEIDSSRDSDPMPYLHGTGAIVEGLEKALEGKTKGDTLDLVVPPEQGYGPRTGQGQQVPREAFEGGEPQPGMPVGIELEEGKRVQMYIAEVNDTHVTLTLDHPLAGMNLHFKVEVMEIRDATKEELEHGHVDDERGDN